METPASQISQQYTCRPVNVSPGLYHCLFCTADWTTCVRPSCEGAGRPTMPATSIQNETLMLAEEIPLPTNVLPPQGLGFGGIAAPHGGNHAPNFSQTNIQPAAQN